MLSLKGKVKLLTKTLRSFIAIELDETVKSALAELQQEFKEYRADVKWVKPDNIHLTLKFLGNIKEESAEKIIKIMEKVCGQYNPFNLNIKGVGMFPNLRAPRVLWIGIENKEVIKPLQKEIDYGMESIGFQRDNKNFKPHLTLCRFRSSIGKNGLLQAVKPHERDSLGTITVKYITFMRSDLNPAGAQYTKIAEVPLKAT